LSPVHLAAIRPISSRFAVRRNRGADSAAVEQQCGELVQHGLNELLLSPAMKRRAGIELKRAVDVDADAAVSMVGKYKQQVLKSV
jgi:hypothetical protein